MNLKVLQTRNFVELDALRFISVTLVALHHLFFKDNLFLNWFSLHGYVGVDIFFTLSGFIITFALIKELELTGTIKLRLFYFKRLIRLWPSWIIALLFSFLLVNSFNDASLKSNLYERFWHYFLHFGNYSSAFWGKIHDCFSHFWSLAVEEHFYLTWPLILVLSFKNKKSLYFTISLLLILPYFFRVYHATNGSPEIVMTFSTHTRFDSLAWGCLLALIYHRLPIVKNRAIDLLIWIVALIIMHQGLALKYFEGSPFISQMAHSLRSIATVLVIFLLTKGHHSNFRFLFKSEVVAKLGILSYGVYLFHVHTNIILFFFLKKFNIQLDQNITALISIILPYFPAFLTYYFIDFKLAKLRERFIHTK